MPEVPDPAHRGSAERLLHEMDTASVDEAVVVGAAITHNPGNNAYLFAASLRHPGRLHPFPDFDSYWVPPRPPATLRRRLVSLAERHTVRGISLYLADDEDGSRLLDPHRTCAFAYAARQHLILSLAMRPQHVSAVRRLACSHRGMPILLHHLGGVTTRSPEPLHAQAAAIAELSTESNVFLKLSGLPYLSDAPWRLPRGPQAAIMRQLCGAFGPRRVCWGSNFPVIDGAITYRQSVEAIVGEYGLTDVDSLMGGTLRCLLDKALSPPRQTDPSGEESP